MYVVNDEINDEEIDQIKVLIKMSELCDNYKHVERVGFLCEFLSYKLSDVSEYSNYITEKYIKNIFLSSQLHDIGKVGIPDRILLKPSKLTPEEFDIMKKHSAIGTNILRKVQKKYTSNKFLDMGINIAEYHHEKWNGSGYPKGISGEDIPLSARIVSLIDVYDALRTKRVYKDAYSHNESVKIIKQGEGAHFDPLICKVLLENQEELRNIYENLMSYEVSTEEYKRENVIKLITIK